MPKIVADEDFLQTLRVAVARSNLNASKAAKIMGLERTLVWRALSGRPVTAVNKSRILSRVARLTEPIERQFDPNMAVHATELLRFLLSAVSEWEATQATEQSTAASGGPATGRGAT
jgi:predicted transcriptional regulator